LAGLCLDTSGIDSSRFTNPQPVQAVNTPVGGQDSGRSSTVVEVS
jgi:hypothetical protein